MTPHAPTAGALALLAAAAGFVSPASGASLRVIDLPLDGLSSSMDVADLTGDGWPDVVLGDVGHNEPGTPGRFVLVAGNGRGGFSAPRPVRTPSALTGIAVGDLTGDGTAEVLTVDGYELTAWSAAGGGMPRPLSVARGGFESSLGLAVGDVLADGGADVVVAGANADAWQVLEGDGGGRLSGTEATFARTGTGGEVALADVDRDGRLDVVSEATVLRNAGAGQWPVVSRLRWSHHVAAVDVDDNGVPDVVSTGGDPWLGWVLVHRNDGTGRVRLVRSWTDPRGFEDLDVGDVDLDGRPDVVVAHGSVDEERVRPDVRALSVLFGDGRGGFAGQTRVRLPFHRDEWDGGAPAAVAVADLDASGRPDILALGRTRRAARLAVALNPSVATPLAAARVTPRRLTAGRPATVAVTLRRPARVAVTLHDQLEIVRLVTRGLPAGTHRLRVTAPRRLGGLLVFQGAATLVVSAHAAEIEGSWTLPVELRRARARRR